MQAPDLTQHILIPALWQVLSVSWPLLLFALAFLVIKTFIELKFPDRRKGRRWRLRHDIVERREIDFALLPVRKKMLMTENEREFVERLERALPEFRIHSQVCMGAVMDPDIPIRERGEYLSVRGRFAQKIIDYVVEDRISGDIIAIVELDDITHKKARDDDRDDMLRAAGYRTIRYRSRAKPTVEEIRARFFPRAVA